MSSIRSHSRRGRSSDPYSERSASSSYSDSDEDPRRKVKNCCRKALTFMCTQVGVGGLIVTYAVMGAIGFRLIEQHYIDPNVKTIADVRNSTLNELWDLTKTNVTLDINRWVPLTMGILLDFQKNVSEAVQKGYNGKVQASDMWSFPGALMFCLSVFTMIGYGNMVPRTVVGKVATIVYAMFGIPLYVLYFRNMGQFLAHTFRWSYTWIYRCSMEDHHHHSSDGSNLYYDGRESQQQSLQRPKRVIVPSTACLWVLFAYVATGTIMFAQWQSWSVMDSVYFCVTSLCKIGIGDLAPDNIFVLESKGGKTARLIITFVYLLFGMGIIAMCFDLMREDVTVRIRNLKNDIGLCFEDIRLRAVDYYKQRNSIE